MEDRNLVLVVGRNPQMMERVLHLLAENQIIATGVLTDEEALRLIHSSQFAVVVFGGGVEMESAQRIESEGRKVNPQLKFVRAHPQTIIQELNRVLGE